LEPPAASDKLGTALYQTLKKAVQQVPSLPARVAGRVWHGIRVGGGCVIRVLLLAIGVLAFVVYVVLVWAKELAVRAARLGKLLL
jgi:hypothetical protein